jgi:precorrin-2 dehydrogenase/sirohydrochlorin ferrochelatase
MTRSKHIAPYPVSLILEETSCLVVGGGTVALRKIESLLAAGARVTVVSPKMSPDVEALEKVELLQREFQPEDLLGKFLVISATDDRSVNEAVARAAKERGILVNVVDVPELCNFFVNSLVHRGDLAISVSTGGASPALAKRIRQELEEQYGEEYAFFLELMREYRPRIIERFPDPQRRQKVFEGIVSSKIEVMLKERGERIARETIEAIINRAEEEPGY